MSSKESSMTVLEDRVNEEATECSKQTKEYRIILPRLPTGMLVTNSLFLHVDMSGRPYKATDFKEVLFSIIDRKDLVALGPFQMSHVWMAVFANGAAKYKVKAQEELEIKKKKCLVIDPTKDEIKMKLLWLPPQLPDSEVMKVLEPFGTVKEITRERWRFSDLQETDTLTRFVTLVLKDHLSVDKVPQMLTIYGVNTLVVIPGRPPLCLRCKAIGHIRRQCSTPRCKQCWRYGHSTEECVVTYASKLQVEFLLDKTQPVVSSDDVRDFSGVVEDDKVYQVYWAGDARTKGSFYDAKVLYMAVIHWGPCGPGSRYEEGSDPSTSKMSSKESSMTVLEDRVNEEATECSKQTKEYRIILPRLPTGNLMSSEW
ncbi:hypothetical protein ISCGN_016793 [Ixodes scapularis]